MARLGLAISGGLSPTEIVECVQLAEDLGYESAWVADVRAEIRDARLEYRSASGQDRSVALGRTLLTLASTAERHALSVRLSEAAETEFTADLVATRPPGADFGELPVTGEVQCSTRQLVLDALVAVAAAVA